MKIFPGAHIFSTPHGHGPTHLIDPAVWGAGEQTANCPALCGEAIPADYTPIRCSAAANRLGIFTNGMPASLKAVVTCPACQELYQRHDYPSTPIARLTRPADAPPITPELAAALTELTALAYQHTHPNGSTEGLQ